MSADIAQSALLYKIGANAPVMIATVCSLLELSTGF